MDNVHIMIGLLVAGFLMLGIGFSNREREWGVWLTGLGTASMFAPILLKMYIELG
ncbi:hypothetical protein TUM18999_50010 [Pseudomonas tohonis]|uniref:Uncharacterized protein n=1 Tax=Pseudomonas tohonis TaxID=2725477 RepID=A0A6J4EB00_9PSED|nr:MULTISPECIES: hypothetical protein [Pseudomonas]BBP85279.1 hypothetical protein PHLH8_49210 [Pseudomonas sp. Pc102]BCG26810.1 hypothetical protein TUM18999_50010 [Pseudomonas tohonis]GJN50454.1 hypothetical protein TUM20286_02060 [Pseudomonas tohonis]